jgi:hypothetical protein
MRLLVKYDILRTSFFCLEESKPVVPQTLPHFKCSSLLAVIVPRPAYAMGLEGSKESVEYSSHHSTSPLEGIDVATFEAEAQKMREISRMDQVVRSRFQQGVRYNMKVLLCGHKKTGKTLLWKRFQGMPFTESVSTARLVCSSLPLTSTLPLSNTVRTNTRDSGKHIPN